jgi:hypothetical protein
MSKTPNKTQPSSVSVAEFVAAVKTDAQRADCDTLIALMRDVTGQEPAMWGPSMIGFGSLRYRHDSGREGDMFVVGFSPRSGKLALYSLMGADGAASLLDRLGTHQLGAACLYVKRLSAIDLDVLRELVALSWQARAAG